LDCSDEVVGISFDVPSFSECWEREERGEWTKYLGEKACETMETQMIVFRMVLFLLLRPIRTRLRVPSEVDSEVSHAVG